MKREIATLRDLSRAELAARWTAIYGVPPPKGARRVLLERAIAWHLQAKTLGGARKEVLRLLATCSATASGQVRVDAHAGQRQRGGAAAITLPAPSPQRATRPLPSPGARLVRDWHGKTHVVDVVGDGYLWQGDSYSSLSVIARAITGARWSGPRFFGL